MTLEWQCWLLPHRLIWVPQSRNSLVGSLVGIWAKHGWYRRGVLLEAVVVIKECALRTNFPVFVLLLCVPILGLAASEITAVILGGYTSGKQVVVNVPGGYGVRNSRARVCGRDSDENEGFVFCFRAHISDVQSVMHS